jgi:hypothetical protein
VKWALLLNPKFAGALDISSRPFSSRQDPIEHAEHSLATVVHSRAS